jgi:hypothetical protein
MKKYIKAIGAVLVIIIISSLVGKTINYDFSFLVGWWSCLAFSHFTDKED